MSNNFRNFQYTASVAGYPDYIIRKDEEKRRLKKLGLYTGAAVLVSVIVQSAIILSLELFGIMDRYYNDAYFSSAVDILVVIIGMLLPFLFFGKKMKAVSGTCRAPELGRPYRSSLMFPAILAGVGLCMLGNIINSYITMFFDSFNVELTAPDIPMAEGVSGIILTFFRVAITAAVVEEIALRGYVMGTLRFYGDSFAIAVSSVVFAAMHGNMVQAPFALMAGFALGYLSVKTGTIWTGIIIHALNNSLSIIVYYLSERYGEEQIAIPYALALYGLIGAGLLCLLYFVNHSREVRLWQNRSLLSTGEKIKAFFLSPTMIITMVYMLYITLEYINPGQ